MECQCNVCVLSRRHKEIKLTPSFALYEAFIEDLFNVWLNEDMDNVMEIIQLREQLGIPDKVIPNGEVPINPVLALLKEAENAMRDNHYFIPLAQAVETLKRHVRCSHAFISGPSL